MSINVENLVPCSFLLSLAEKNRISSAPASHPGPRDRFDEKFREDSFHPLNIMMAQNHCVFHINNTRSFSHLTIMRDENGKNLVETRRCV